MRLVPDTTGEYIALCSQRNLHVVKLVKHRGEFGEYFGWLKEPTFRYIYANTPYFAAVYILCSSVPSQ